MSLILRITLELDLDMTFNALHHHNYCFKGETVENTIRPYVILKKERKKMDVKGIEPLAFRMQSERSTTDLNAQTT